MFCLVYRLISKYTGAWIIVGAPALWVALEYIRSNFFALSFPWNLLGHSQYRYLPVIQIADITGVYGISFLMVMANQFLSQVPDLFRHQTGFQSFRSTKGRNFALQAVTVVLVFVFVILYGWHYTGGLESSERIRVALVQANLLTRDNMPIADQKEHLLVYQRLTREAALRKPDLIVWPSSSLPGPFSTALVRFTVKRLTSETGIHLLVGGAGREKLSTRKAGFLPYSNSEFLLAPSGYVEGRYDKMRLVPFNEYLPMHGKIKWPRWVTNLEKSFIPGKTYTLFQISGKKFGTPICSENMFPNVFRRFVRDGARFMVSVTNEGFLGHTQAPYQSLVINVFRAVENKVAIVRSATTGVSGFIDPDGEIVDRIRDGDGNDLFVSGILARDVPLSNEKTFYTMHGDIFAYVVMGLAVLIALFSLLAPKVSRSQSRT